MVNSYLYTYNQKDIKNANSYLIFISVKIENTFLLVLPLEQLYCCQMDLLLVNDTIHYFFQIDSVANLLYGACSLKCRVCA